MSESGPGKQTTAESRSHRGGLERLFFLFEFYYNQTNNLPQKTTPPPPKAHDGFPKGVIEKIILAKE